MKTTVPVKLPTGAAAALKEGQRIMDLEKELDALKRDAASKPPGTVIDAWLDNKKWNKKVCLLLRYLCNWLMN